MEIIHRIAYWDRWNKPLKNQMKAEGIKVKEVVFPDYDVFVSFDISESHPFWKQISRLQKKPLGWFKYSSISDTYFTDQEILNSAWSRVYVENVKKYPEPSHTWVTNPVNYDNFCRNCGTHVQARPFRIQREPNWGYFHFFTFFWGHPLFCRGEVIEEFERNHLRGLQKMDLVINKNDAPTQDIYQIVPVNMTRGGLIVPKHMRTSSCRKCGNRKYGYHDRGIMQYRRDPIMDEVDILYTGEWFGTGGKDAWRELLVSNKFARMVLEQGWKGIRFKAVELV